MGLPSVRGQCGGTVITLGSVRGQGDYPRRGHGARCGMGLPSVRGQCGGTVITLGSVRGQGDYPRRGHGGRGHGAWGYGGMTLGAMGMRWAWTLGAMGRHGPSARWAWAGMAVRAWERLADLLSVWVDFGHYARLDQ